MDIMLSDTLQERLINSADKKLPFILFAEPNSNLVHLYIQQSDTLFQPDQIEEDGFVMAPFDDKEQIWFLPFSKSEYVSETLDLEPLKTIPVQRKGTKEAQQQHQELVSKGIEFIQKAKAEKIVLAREEKIELETWNPVVVAHRLLALYPSAFRFMWYHPLEGWWCGATPETLIETQGKRFFTMALAGTRAYYGEEPQWRTKERNEQQFVTDTILDEISSLCQTIRVSKTYTQPAGSVAHLRTDIKGNMLPTTTLNDMARAIHPTPAICGTPTEIAKQFILKEEHFERKFYAGFLGIVEKKNKSRMYVNLRSMRVNDNFASLFVGGGITYDSNPQEEWIETCNKTQTMLQVIQPLIK